MSLNQLELLEKSPLAIVVSDHNERVIWCNAQFLQQMHLESGQVIGKLYPSLPLEAIDKNAEQVQLFTEGANAETRFQYWQAPLDSTQGAKAHYFAQERQHEHKLGMAAARVENKLPKRANWVEFLDYEVSRSRRYNNPLSLLKLHLVVFDKPISVVDETLHQTIKDTLMDELRWADMVGHTDLGTYLLVLPETPSTALVALQNKLTQALQRQFDFIEKGMKYRVVYGEASWQAHDDSPMLLQRARNDLVTKLESLLDQLQQAEC